MAETGKGIVERIVKASLAVSVAHVVLKLLGLVQAIVAARYLSRGTFDVLYVFVFEGVIFSIYSVTEEIIGPTFLPVFLGEKDRTDERQAWAFANLVVTVQLLLLLGTILVLSCFPDQVLHVFTDWDPVNDADKWKMGRQGVQWLAPSLLCLSLGCSTYMLLNGYKRFFLAAFGDASTKICVVAALVVGIGVFHYDYRALLFGLLAGSVAKLLTHLIGLWRQLHFVRFSLGLRNPAFRTMLLLVLPLLIGIVLSKVRDIYNNVTVLTHIQTEGLMQANSLGRKFYLAAAWLVPYAVATAMFPFFCELVDRKDLRRLGELMTSTGRMILSVCIPLAVLGAVLAEPVAILALQRGHFSLEAAQWTAVSIVCYLVVLPAYAFEYTLMRGFFANRQTVAVTVASVFCSFLSMFISYVLIVRYGVSGTAALVTVALGFSLTRTLKVVILVGWLKRTVPLFPVGPSVVFFVRTVVVAALTGGAAWGVVWLFTHHVSAGMSKPILLAKLVLAGSVGLSVCVAAVLLLRLEEPVLMARWAVDKLRGRLGKKVPGTGGPASGNGDGPGLDLGGNG